MKEKQSASLKTSKRKLIVYLDDEDDAENEVTQSNPIISPEVNRELAQESTTTRSDHQQDLFTAELSSSIPQYAKRHVIGELDDEMRRMMTSPC